MNTPQSDASKWTIGDMRALFILFISVFNTGQVFYINCIFEFFIWNSYFVGYQD